MYKDSKKAKDQSSKLLGFMYTAYYLCMVVKYTESNVGFPFPGSTCTMIIVYDVEILIKITREL